MERTELSATVPESAPGARAVRLWLEMVLVFFGLPALVAAYVDPRRRFDGAMRAVGLDAMVEPGFPRFRLLLPALVFFALVIFAWLLLDRTFSKVQLWNGAACRRELRRLGLLFIVAAAFILGVAVGLDATTDWMTATGPDGATRRMLLHLPREAPIVLLLIAVGYPWLSAYPQEVMYRAFFFHRYRAILPGRWAMIAGSAVAFTWLHAPFWNWFALAMTLPGGVLFAWTYDRTRSTLAATIEHALYGWWVFFTGLGWFVYAGSLGG